MFRQMLVVIVVLSCLIIGLVVALAVIGTRLAQKEKEGSSSAQEQDLPDFDTCDDISIIGAGITGSNAAWRMRDRNMSISIYEYSDRIGGRCYTVKLQGIPDINIEMGAMRFKPHDHTVLNSTITELGLDIVDFVLGYGGGGNTLFYLRGKHMSYDELPTKAPYEIPDNVRVDFDTFVWHLYNNFTKSELGITDDLTAENRQKIKTLDNTPLGMISRRVYDALYLDSETAQYFADANAFRSESAGLSAANWLPVSDPNADTGDSDPNPVKTVKQGFQAIPTKMVEQFLNASSKHKLFRNHHLKSVRKHTNGRYILTFQPTETTAGITSEVMSAKQVVKCAKKVILAVSRMGLQHIDWEGFKQSNITDMLKNAVQDVVAGKIFFGYNSQWWANTTLGSKYQHAISTTPLRQTYDFAVSSTSGKAVLNPSYTDYTTAFWRDVKNADSYLPSTEDGNQQLAMSNTSVYLARKFYAEVYNLTLDQVPPPNAAVMKLWDEYPFGAAWYDWSPGYRWKEVEVAMMKPSHSDDVFVTSNVFSSDQLSDWTEGGLRMVDRLLKSYFV